MTAARVRGSGVEVVEGAELPGLEQTATLHTSVAYAGASGDLNPLHYDATFAAEVSPTGEPIAHGMYGMALAGRVLTSWCGAADAIGSITVRFARPWPLGETAELGGKVTKVDGETATVELWGRTQAGARVLRGSATVRLEQA